MSFYECMCFFNDWKWKIWFSFQSHLQIKAGYVSEHQEAKYVQMGWKLQSVAYLMDHRNGAAARDVPASGSLAQTPNSTFPELDSLAQSRWQEQFSQQTRMFKIPWNLEYFLWSCHNSKKTSLITTINEKHSRSHGSHVSY